MAKKVKDAEDKVIEQIKETVTAEIEHQHPDDIVRPTCEKSGPVSTRVDVDYLKEVFKA